MSLACASICRWGNGSTPSPLRRGTAASWQPFAAATSVGNQRLLRGENVTTSKVRLRVTKAAACPAISEFGLFLSPE